MVKNEMLAIYLLVAVVSMCTVYKRMLAVVSMCTVYKRMLAVVSMCTVYKRMLTCGSFSKVRCAYSTLPFDHWP